jgi:hypothetical protein
MIWPRVNNPVKWLQWLKNPFFFGGWNIEQWGVIDLSSEWADKAIDVYAVFEDFRHRWGDTQRLHKYIVTDNSGNVITDDFEEAKVSRLDIFLEDKDFADLTKVYDKVNLVAAKIGDLQDLKKAPSIGEEVYFIVGIVSAVVLIGVIVFAIWRIRLHKREVSGSDTVPFA